MLKVSCASAECKLKITAFLQEQQILPMITVLLNKNSAGLRDTPRLRFGTNLMHYALLITVTSEGSGGIFQDLVSVNADNRCSAFVCEKKPYSNI